MQFLTLFTLVSAALSGVLSNPIDSSTGATDIITSQSEAVAPNVVTAAYIVVQIDAVTLMSQQASDYVNTLTPASFTPFVFPATAAAMGQRFFGIARAFGPLITMVGKPGAQPPFSDADTKLIVAPLVAFVKIHQNLLNVVLGKNSFLSKYGPPGTGPVLAGIRAIETVVDTVAFALIGLISKPFAPDVMKEFGMLKITVAASAAVYSKSC